MKMYDIISKKKYCGELSREEIQYFINGYVKGEIPDYQVSSLLMAILLNGLNISETIALTEVMVKSGEQIDLSEIKGVKVDKHSTGGVGDKVSLIAGPLAAASGIPVAKMSGKGLGHTGGTIDKLESIDGLKTTFTKKEFVQNVKKVGICISSQTADIVPADKKLYSLRDVTATIDSIPLIAASIMSKKIASGGDKIVLDVKCGNGAFLKNLKDAENLADTMTAIGRYFKKETRAIITDMNIPLGRNIGNILEVREAFDVLNGKGDRRLTELSVEITAHMLNIAGMDTLENSRKTAIKNIENKSGLEKLKSLIANQNGRIDKVMKFDKNSCISYRSKFDGMICGIDTEKTGLAAMALGAGREKKDQNIDYECGFIFEKTIGDSVRKNEEILKIYPGSGNPERAIEILDDTFIYGTEYKNLPLIYKIIK